MKIINLKKNKNYLEEYVTLCNLEWGKSQKTDDYVQEKIEKILKDDKVISVLGLVDKNTLIGFISLFKYDGEERKNLTPWYATMYVKENYRKKGYSVLLNNAIIDEARKLGFKKVYLKTDLNNYYEQFGAIYMEKLKSGEKLYYIDCD